MQMDSKMASWLFSANMESVKPQPMPPPSAFAFPYGQSSDADSEGPTAGGTHEHGLASGGMGTVSDGDKVCKTFTPKQRKKLGRNTERKAIALYKRRKKINQMVKNTQDQQKRRILLKEKWNIVKELKTLINSAPVSPQVPPHSPPADNVSACSDHSHKENNVKCSDILNKLQMPDGSLSRQGVRKLKSKRFLRKRRKEVHELLNNTLLTKKRKAELEQELIDINHVLIKPKRTVFDELDFQYAEQLFGNDKEGQDHDVEQYIPDQGETVEPFNNSNIFYLKKTIEEIAMWSKSQDTFAHLGEQEANKTHLGESYRESFSEHTNDSPAFSHQYNNSISEVHLHGNHEERFEHEPNPASHFINETLANDCRSFLERIGVMKTKSNFQLPLLSGPHPRESSPDFPYRERSQGRSYTEGSPGLSNRERSPAHSYREGSSDLPYRDRSPSLSYREASPSHPYRERSPGPSYREGNPGPYHRRRSPGLSHNERSSKHSYRERSPYHRKREMSPGPSYRKRERSPYPAYRERFPDLSYRSRSDRGDRDPRSRDSSLEPASSSRSPRFYGRMEGTYGELREDYSPRMDDHSSFQDHEDEEDLSEDERKEEAKGEEDLRLHLLRLREQKVERKLKILEQASMKTESKLRRMQERRLSEELDDFLREQSKHWKKEDMGRERTKEFSPQHDNGHVRHSRRSHEKIYF